MSISLVYLCRGKGAGIVAADRFIDFYSKNDPGCEHNFVVILKGWEKNQNFEKNALKLRFKVLGANFIELADDGFDWGAYMRVAKILRTKYIFFLNSFSRPLNDFWLKHMLDCIESNNVGMCGASAALKGWKFSWPYFNFELKTFIIYPLKVIRRFYNYMLVYHFYTKHYCPHLRSNGFAVERNTFLKFSNLRGIPSSKQDCYLLESGTNSYSDYIKAVGKNLVLVDKNGVMHDICDWGSSNTYCCPGQPNLCIADNNTDLYEAKSQSAKRQMEFDVWGEVFNE
jgi:hypothetical protein